MRGFDAKPMSLFDLSDGGIGGATCDIVGNSTDRFHGLRVRQVWLRSGHFGGWVVGKPVWQAEFGISMAKLRRAHGGCLGVERRRAWKSAKCLGELTNKR